MDGRRSTRRNFLGAVIGSAALLGVGRLQGALATYNYGSKAELKRRCELEGGTYVDSPKDNLTACFFPNGSKTVCNANGNDCISYPAKASVPGTVLSDRPELVSADPTAGAPATVDPAVGDPAVLNPSVVGTGKRHRRGKRRKK